jgi:hypothetical protein
MTMVDLILPDQTDNRHEKSARGSRFWSGNAVSRRRERAERSEGVGTRTQDLRIKSPLLYQLSYTLGTAVRHRQKWARPADAAGA